MSTRPIFIVGSPRSGTTLLRLILDSHPNISCGPETHVLNPLQDILTSHWQGFQMYNGDRDYWVEKISTFFASFKDEYAHARGKGRWADKSPPYTVRMDYISELFPDCQFIHIIRDGRDVVASHKSRWGFKAGWLAIDRWRRFVQSGRRFGKDLPKDRYQELRYEELVADPESAMRPVFEYLGEAWVPEVLEYDKFDHDVPGPQNEHAAAHREGNGSPAIYKSKVGSAKRHLGPVLGTVFRMRNGALLHELGYQ